MSGKSKERFWRCTAPGVNATFATKFGVIMFLISHGGKGVRIYNTANLKDPVRVGKRKQEPEAALSYQPVDPTGAYGTFAPDEPVSTPSVNT